MNIREMVERVAESLDELTDAYCKLHSNLYMVQSNLKRVIYMLDNGLDNWEMEDLGRGDGQED